MSQSIVEGIVERLVKNSSGARKVAPPAGPSRKAGRPRTDPDKGPLIGRPISLHLTTLGGIEKAAAIAGMTPAAWMRRALEEALDATRNS